MTEWQSDRVWIVVPAYCEQSTIGRTVSELISTFEHVVVVDDGSVDATGREAQQAGACLLTHLLNLGQGAALQTGIEYSLKQDAEWIVTFDADGQHQVSDITMMLDHLVSSKADVVLGSRFLGTENNVPWLRKVVLKLAVIFTNVTTGMRLTDTHNGLRVMTAASASMLNISQNRMAHASEIIEKLARSEFKVVEVPVTVTYTEYSLAKGQSIAGSFRILSDIFLGWLSR